MKRIRVAGLVEVNDGFAFIHRKNVKKIDGTNKPYGEYYVFPGGGLEEYDDSLEDGAKREIKEELGIEVKVKEKICYRCIKDEYEEHLFLCEYLSGEFGTGDGPEYNNDPKYIDRGEYIPEIVLKNKFNQIRILPEEFKNQIMIKFNL